MLRVTLVSASTAVLVLACGPDVIDTASAGSGGSGGSGGSPPEPIVEVLNPDAPPLPGFDTCEVVITENLPMEGQTHVPVCDAVTYETNPPSSGDHWPLWAEYRLHESPVPRQVLVHNLEHGAIVMSHRCSEGGAECTSDVLAAFEEAADTFGVDPLCASVMGAAIRSRVVVTEDPLLETPIALAGWRATYTATCIDVPSMVDFFERRYGKGTEQTCAQGKDPLDETTGVPACAN